MPRRGEVERELATLRGWVDDQHEKDRENMQRWMLRSEELIFAATLLQDRMESFNGLTTVERDEWIEAVHAFLATYFPPPMSYATTAARVTLKYDRRADGSVKRYPHWPLERAYPGTMF